MPPDSSSTTTAPALATSRLVLHGHTVADFEACAAMWADPLVTRHIGGRPFSEEEVWARLLRYAGLWALLGFGYWAVRERSSGRFVGEVGIADFRRDITPALGEAPEVGWVLAPWAHGRGFATEAVLGALAWSDSHLGSPRTVCLIDPANVASVRVARKCGYRESAPAVYRGSPTLVFAREASSGAPTPG